MKKKYIFLVSGLLLIAVVCLGVILKQSRAEKFEVIFFDIGQGDSAFIETPNDFQVLIDGGPDAKILDKLGAEMSFYDKTIDLIILSHPDRDHLTGLLEVLKKYEIKNVLWTGIIYDTAEFAEWQKLLKNEGAKITIAKAGERIILEQAVYLDILFPFESIEGQEIKEGNDTSIVAKLMFADRSFLFSGDISAKIEKQIVEKYISELDADVIKIAHHGSKYSSSEEFIQAVSPEKAVISVGENNWGHPTPETLQTLRNFGIDILITKEKGDIKFSF